MSGQDQFCDMQSTLTRLLDVQSKQGSDQSSLIMLSLVNLMGIVDILSKRMQKSTSTPAYSNSPLDLTSLQHLVGPLLNVFAKQGQSDCKTQQPDRSFNQTEQVSTPDIGSGQNSGSEQSNGQASKQNGAKAKAPVPVNPLAGLLNLLGGGGSQPNLVPLLAMLGIAGGNQSGLNSLLSMLNNQSNQKVDLGSIMNIISGLAGTTPQVADQNKGNEGVRDENNNASVGESQSEESQEDKNRIIIKKGGQRELC